jgi:hypothetical protein
MDAKFHSENEYGFILNILNNYVVIKKTLKDGRVKLEVRHKPPN